MKQKRPYEPPAVISFPSSVDDKIARAFTKCQAGGTPTGTGHCLPGGTTGAGQKCNAGTVAGADCQVGSTAQERCQGGGATGGKCQAGGVQGAV